ncbi:MAG: hypothetical protein LBF58_00615 [Deltaproteobacteria bacterium]|jgi:hypothetical protein|nr:hypothetical protein [Deltaproteobacteria bacterium]
MSIPLTPFRLTGWLTSSLSQITPCHKTTNEATYPVKPYGKEHVRGSKLTAKPWFFLQAETIGLFWENLKGHNQIYSKKSPALRNHAIYEYLRRQRYQEETNEEKLSHEFNKIQIGTKILSSHIDLTFLFLYDFQELIADT